MNNSDKSEQIKPGDKLWLHRLVVTPRLVEVTEIVKSFQEPQKVEILLGAKVKHPGEPESIAVTFEPTGALYPDLKTLLHQVEEDAQYLVDWVYAQRRKLADAETVETVEIVELQPVTLPLKGEK